jgi:hypothetical protein
MSRVLVESTWYERLAPNALLELEYQRLLISHADHLYPEYHVIPYGRLIESEIGAAIADIAFIAKDFSGWWIVEVELTTHSLEGHVLPQIDVFLTGRYGLEDAEYLASHATSLNQDRIRDVVRGEQPEVLVIVNGPRDDWTVALRARGASMAVAEVFRSATGKHILRINGDYPWREREPTLLSRCSVERAVGRLVRLESPATVPFAEGSKLYVEYEGSVTEWLRLDTADAVYLTPARGSPLPPDCTSLELLREETGRLRFRIGRT